MGLEPAPNNGTAGYLHHLLNHPAPLEPVSPPTGMPEDCSYPSTDEEYYERIDQDVSECMCDIEVSTELNLIPVMVAGISGSVGNVIVKIDHVLIHCI